MNVRDELKNIVIKLEDDPLSFGLDYFNMKIAEIQAYKERVSTILTEVIKNRLIAQHELEKVQLEYDNEFSKLISSDPSISSLKSSDKRESSAKVILQDLNKKVLEAKKKFIDIDILFKEVQHKYEMLKDSAEYLFKQLSVCQMLVQFDNSLIKKVVQTKNKGE